MTAQVSTDPGFAGTSLTFTGASDATKDFTLKITANGLLADTRYYDVAIERYGRAWKKVGDCNDDDD